jgi:hypothetical protein
VRNPADIGHVEKMPPDDDPFFSREQAEGHLAHAHRCCLEQPIALPR